MTNSRIKHVALARARRIHLMRTLMSGMVLATTMAVVALYLLGREVWVARVIQNMPSPANILAVGRFFESAFLNTTFAVQLLSLVLIFAVLWAARDAARSIHAGMRFA